MSWCPIVVLHNVKGTRKQQPKNYNLLGYMYKNKNWKFTPKIPNDTQPKIPNLNTNLTYQSSRRFYILKTVKSQWQPTHLYWMSGQLSCLCIWPARISQSRYPWYARNPNTSRFSRSLKSHRKMVVHGWLGFGWHRGQFTGVSITTGQGQCQHTGIESFSRNRMQK